MAPAKQPDRKSGQKKQQQKDCSAFYHSTIQQHAKYQRQQQVELLFNTKRPGVRESALGGQIEAQILCKGEVFPEWGDRISFPAGRDQKIHCHDKQIGWYYPEKPFDKKLPERYFLQVAHLFKQLGGDQVAAQHKEQVYTRPAELADRVDPCGVWKGTAVMKQENECDRDSSQKIESGKPACC